MELQFSKKTLPYLCQIIRESKSQEQTQELRMPEDMPDVGRILGAWGQVLLRSKEWRSDSILISGGVMAWVLYLPEGEDDRLQTVEAWIPFQVKWELPQMKHDGRILVTPLLCSVDARSTSARKMMVRTNVSLMTEVCVPEDQQVFVPDSLPEDIHVKKCAYPLHLPREAGEKTFTIEEELTLPSSCPRIERLIRFSMQPELIDRKVLSGKVVFRGAALLHILYADETKQLHTWDFEIPFSQYAELDEQYEQQATARILPVVTALELDTEPDGVLRLKAGLTGQYLICDTSLVEVAQDAYSANREMQVHTEHLQLPAVLEEKQEMILAEKTVPATGLRVADISFYLNPSQQQNYGNQMRAEISGTFQVLYYDENEKLQNMVSGWNTSWALPMAENACFKMTVTPSRVPTGEMLPSEVQLRSDVLLDGIVSGQEGIPMITMLEAGQLKEPDPNRPSLILCRQGKKSLWELAKENGSTVDAICKANHLETEPEDDRILMIPVL